MLSFLNRKNIFYGIAVLLTIFFLFVNLNSTLPTLSSSSQSQHYFTGKVTQILKEGTKKIHGTQNPFQEVTVRFQDNGQEEIRLIHGGDRIIANNQKLKVGQSVILSKVSNTDYLIYDQYRLPQIGVTIGIFFLTILFITRKKGVGSLLGLGFSFLVIIKGIIPLIMGGYDPLLVSIIGSLIILSVSIYLAHGLNEQTSVAVFSTFISLVLTGILAIVFVKMVALSGLGSEDIYTLQFRFAGTINFQGLLLGGIIIGALGVLDDVTTAQSATVYELAKTDRNLNPSQLFKKGMNVGKEHISSLVNTLVLAYAGASIGIFIYIFLALQTGDTPLWVILNSEMLAEEIVRTLAGSIGLVLAVPITTVLAAFFSQYSFKIK